MQNKRPADIRRAALILAEHRSFYLCDLAVIATNREIEVGLLQAKSKTVHNRQN